MYTHLKRIASFFNLSFFPYITTSQSAAVPLPLQQQPINRWFPIGLSIFVAKEKFLVKIGETLSSSSIVGHTVILNHSPHITHNVCSILIVFSKPRGDNDTSLSQKLLFNWTKVPCAVPSERMMIMIWSLISPKKQVEWNLVWWSEKSKNGKMKLFCLLCFTSFLVFR